MAEEQGQGQGNQKNEKGQLTEKEYNGILGLYRSEFRTANLFFPITNIDLFNKSQWPMPSTIFVSYKLAVAIYTTIVVIINLTKKGLNYFVYISEISYSVIMIYFVISSIRVLVHDISQRIRGKPPPDILVTPQDIFGGNLVVIPGQNRGFNNQTGNADISGAVKNIQTSGKINQTINAGAGASASVGNNGLTSRQTTDNVNQTDNTGGLASVGNNVATSRQTTGNNNQPNNAVTRSPVTTIVVTSKQTTGSSNQKGDAGAPEAVGDVVVTTKQVTGIINQTSNFGAAGPGTTIQLRSKQTTITNIQTNKTGIFSRLKNFGRKLKETSGINDQIDTTGPINIFERITIYIEWLVKHIAYFAAPIVTISYGFTGEGPLTMDDVNANIMNIFIVLIDLLLSASPVKLYHIVWAIFYGILYGLFSYLYYTKYGIVLYKNLTDWSDPSNVIKNLSLIIFVGAFLSNLLIYVLYSLRVASYSKLMKHYKSMSNEKTVIYVKAA
ncbi:hypothetical protein HELRODRAFT_177816 [Helobdella robusta]|uniref:Uncharacterized protein n=1 Tax=Helobdella robusta TaxID=6412 RepID=T1FCB4_HELRO|nr:hypothetical protein HELRODRAFT_177816 [Helobdella robusta]ESN97754.1 hypothetical protein HELRODRAFT_177816 [Helobdella robusta]